MKIHIFNPDADLALADNRESYIAPAPVRQMARDLALLPFWYAGEGEGVKVDTPFDRSWVEQMNQTFHRQVCPVTSSTWSSFREVEFVPWGWSVVERKRLIDTGVDKADLPTDEALEVYRQAASRFKVADWLADFSEMNLYGVESRNLYEEESCRRYVEAQAASVLKAPWSGSGKGLKWCQGVFTPSIAGWCRRLLREQGGVVASPVYDKREDLALEFSADGGGNVRFEGYSLFTTHTGGAYAGNELVSDEDFQRRMNRYGVWEALENVRCRIQEVASRHIASYRGKWGIDMMVCADTLSDGYWLHPCVEVNLRMNMGILAGALRQRLLAPGSTGRLLVEYFPDSASLYQRHRWDEAHNPLRVEQGRVVEGYLSLCPLTSGSRYRAALYTYIYR